MLLAVDVGNTQTRARRVRRERDRPPLACHDRGAADGRRARHGRRPPARASVISTSTRSTASACRRRCLPSCGSIESFAERYAAAPLLVVGPGTKTGLPILYDDPREIGPDRIVNAVAASERYGVPVIVVDFGTSTNFDAVSAAGEYVGGVLAPGIEVSMDALFARAARLVKVDFAAPRDGDRQDHRRLPPVRARLRVRRPGRRHRHQDAR